MQHAWVKRGLWVVFLSVSFGFSTVALAETNTATVQPQPRPETMIATAPTPSVQDTLPSEQAPSAASATDHAEGPQRGPVTGFPLPRFVSLKASEANARRGPSRSHRIDWVFQRRNMPVMVVAEHGHWRRIIDRDGAGGWVHHTLLSGARTAIVTAEMLPIYTRPDASATIRARAERDVIAELRQCRANWCEIDAGGFRGWVEVTGLWGVDPGEDID